MSGLLDKSFGLPIVRAMGAGQFLQCLAVSYVSYLN